MDACEKIEQLIRRSRVSELTSYSKSELYRLIKVGRFPAPIPKAEGERSSLWVLSEVAAHIHGRIRRRDEQSAQQEAPRDPGGRFESQHEQTRPALRAVAIAAESA